MPLWKREIILEDEMQLMNNTQPIQTQNKVEQKDEFADIENADNSADENDDVISLDEASLEEEQSTKN